MTEERNGSFELALTYPITGRKYKELILGRVILARHSDGADLQPFRIYKITKPLNGKVEVYAEHISYQLSKIPVMPFTANSVTAALDGLVANAAETCPFSVWTDKTTKANFKVEYPASFRSLLGGVQGSILDIYGGGEYEWDMWTVKLHGNRGKDSGVEIRYGKNLTELEATSDTSGVYTGVCPFWRGEDGDVVTLPEKVIHATTQFSYSLTIPLDLSGEFENKPTEAQLRAKAQSYLNSNNGWELKENIKISFVALWQTKEYKSVAPLQRLNLCDTATVIHDKLGVRCKAKVVKTVYNCLLNRYDEIELGEARTNLTDTVRESVAKRIKDEVPSKTYLREAIDRATRLIAGGLGGHLVIGTNANGEPNELLIMDTDDKNTAVNCIRINANGIGFSTTGYNGTYRTAWTLDGHFVADFIDSGILSANVIKTGLLKDRTGKNFWNLETGEFQMSSETITVDGKEVATLDDINEAQRIAQSAIKSVKVEYSYSTSPTTAPTKNWSTKAPEWQSGRYIWQRTVTTTSTETLTSDPVCISGAKGDTGERGLQGLQGEKGDQGIQGATGARGATGKSTYFHIAYAKSAGGVTGFSTSDPTDRDYIGTYVDTTAADSTDPAKYAWQLVKGAQGEQGEKGIAGKNGADGKTSYLHIAYATSSDGKTGFSTMVSTGKTYIGQYVDFTANDSTDPTKYSWTLIKGEKGDRGLQGLQGEKGDQGIPGTAGVSTYFHIAYAKSADGKTGFSTSDPDGREYIGTYVDSTKTDSTDPSKYAWQLVKGAQGAKGEKGIAGKNGADGKTSYLHIAYATSADGKTGFSTTVSSAKTYIGQYVDFTEADSTDPTKYSWTLIKGDKGDRGLQGLQGEKGDQGIQGEKGATGKSSYFHIAYAKSADGQTGFSVSDPDGRDYIGTYVDTSKTDSTDPTKYSWQLVKGAQGEKGEKGIAGKNGADGKTSYLHIAYATSADGKTGFSTTVSTGKTYIGQYVDFTAADSTDHTKYNWTLIKGEKGDRGLQGIQGEKGEQGIQGAKGAAGVSTYFHIAYAKSADGKTGFSVSDPTDRDYIGTYVDSTKTDSTDPTKYAWQLVKGAQGAQGEKGIAGKNGADGKTSYLHIAYATSADGKTGFSTTVSTGKTYIGQYVDFTAADSTDYTKYSWTLIKGEKGERGLQGIQGEKGDQGIQGAKGATGAAGVSSYFHIAYAKSADGKTGFSVSDPTGRDYIGTYVDTTKTDSTDPTKYAWQLVKGAQGIQGEKGIAGKNGADGKTSYLHIAYANSADGKTGFSITDSTDKTYIGQYVDFTETDSTDYKKYTWSLIKGADGVSIVAVQNVYMISNNASGEVSNKSFNYLSDINAPTLAKVNGVADRYFSDKANEASCTTEWVKLTNPPDGLEYGARFTITEAKGKMRSVCWYGSNRSVPLVDGKTYTLSFYARVTSGKVRIHFRSGISSYPVYKTEDITASAWTRYSCTFKYNAAANKELNGLGTRIYLGVTSTYIGTCEMCGFQLEEGSTVSALLPETPGWNALMAAPSATNRYLWQYEVITYSDGTSTETTPGIIGAYSADGRGVKSVTEYYAINNSTTAPADSEFTTTVKATTTSNKYLWNYEVMELTDGTKLSSKKHIISTHGATGATGNGIKSVAITYATSTSNTTAPSSGWNSSVPSVAQGSYLWTRTVTTMTDGTSSTSYSVARQGEKGDTGATGAAGVGVKSTAVTYQAGSSGTTIPTGTWVTSIPSVSQGQYLWTRTVITYTDSKTSTAYSVSRNGKDGTSVTMIDVEYAQSTSATTAPTSGWQTSAPAWVNGKYIWQRTVTKYSSGTTDTSKPVCITGEKGATGAKGDKGDTGAKGATGATGAKGDKGDTGAKGATGAKGDTGIGVKAITEQYYLSNSKTAQSGGSWVATAPAYKKDWYYWTRSKIDWTDGTTTYTAAVLASGVNSANEKVANMEVGGRNLILNSDFNKTTSGGIVTVSGDEIIFDSSAVGSAVTPYTVTLSLSAFAKTNLRGKKIIMSMDYKVDRAVSFGDTNPWGGAQLTLSRDTNTGGSTQSLNLLGNKTIPTAVTGKWVRVTATYNVTDYDLTGALIKFWFRDAKGKVRFRHPKVEIGNVATDWTPAPEDAKSYTDAQIVITKADIKKTTDSISLEVSKKVGANEIISKINQTAESVTIKADKINFNGMITANKTFKIDTSGYMQATGGKVGGWKITSNSLENTETATYVKLNSGSFTAGTWSGQNIFAIGTKGSDGKVEVRWGVNQYGDMYAQTVKTEGLTVNMGGTISGTMNFKGLVMLSAGVQLTNSDKTNISVPSGKVNIVHGGKSYSLINFIKGVANGSIT